MLERGKDQAKLCGVKCHMNCEGVKVFIINNLH